MRLAEGAQPALDQGGVGQDPAVQGAVVDRKAPLLEQLLDVTVAERVSQVPGDRLQDQCRLEVAALEVVLGPALQLLDKGIQEHGPPPNRRRQSQPVCLTSRERQKFATSPFWRVLRVVPCCE